MGCGQGAEGSLHRKKDFNSKIDAKYWSVYQCVRDVSGQKSKDFSRPIFNPSLIVLLPFLTPFCPVFRLFLIFFAHLASLVGKLATHC